MYIPDLEEMDQEISTSYRIPSAATMEQAVAKKTTVRTPKEPKPKPACRYGPRLENGLCPLKPKKNVFQKDIDRRVTGVVKRAGDELIGAVISRTVNKPQLTLPHPIGSTVASRAADAAKKASGAGAAAGITAGGAAAVAGAGIAAFLGTQYLRKLVSDQLDARMLAKKDRDLKARKNWNLAMSEMRKREGRDLTESETRELYNLFFEDKK